MKREILFLLALCLSMAGFAQNETGKQKDGLQLGIYLGATNSSNENIDEDNKRILLFTGKNSISMGGNVTISKEFANLWGWRASVGFYNNRGNSNGITAPEAKYYSFQDVEEFADITFDITDAIWPNRNNAFSLKLFAGVGLAETMGLPKADAANRYDNINSENGLTWGFRGGLNASWRLSDKLRLAAQVSATGFGDKFNGQKNGASLDGREDIQVGLTYCFGK